MFGQATTLTIRRREIDLSSSSGARKRTRTRVANNDIDPVTVSTAKEELLLAMRHVIDKLNRQDGLNLDLKKVDLVEEEDMLTFSWGAYGGLQMAERVCALLRARLFPKLDGVFDRCECTEEGVIQVGLHPSLLGLVLDEDVSLGNYEEDTDEKYLSDSTGEGTDVPLAHPLMRPVNIESFDPQTSLGCFISQLDHEEYQDHHCACRSRGYNTFDYEMGRVTVQPLRSFEQAAAYNDLAAQQLIPEQRVFAPLPCGFVESAPMSAVIKQTMDGVGQIRNEQVPFAELGIHFIKIRTNGEGGVGTPVPEGRHQDGFDYVSITVLERRGIDGGVNLFAESKTGAPFLSAIVQPGHGFVIDDRTLWHDVEPILATQDGGSRCVVVVTVTVRASPKMNFASAA